MKLSLFIFILSLFTILSCNAQTRVETSQLDKKSGVQINHKNDLLRIRWPAEEGQTGEIIFDLRNDSALFKSISLIKGKTVHQVLKDAEPVFWLTIGERDLVSQNGWNIFFDKVPLKPHRSYKVQFHKSDVTVRSKGVHTLIEIGQVEAESFKGVLEITLFHGSNLMNIAAVMATGRDAVAIVYDAGIVSQQPGWNRIAFVNVKDSLEYASVRLRDSAVNKAVKFRTIIGNSEQGSLAVFPPPHQYFYPLDEAFNLKFTWFGSNFHHRFSGYGIGIRQELNGDNRFVPWFNAPPGTKQRLNFFCQLSGGDAAEVLTAVKKYTHNDRYQPLPGYKTMSSHFHNEFVTKVIMANQPVPDTPNFVRVFKQTGIDMVHLAEFHYTAHPKGPDELRLLELRYLFEMCKRYSDRSLLLMPGEEPNEFFGGHWLQLFPTPVYWIMSRKDNQPVTSTHPIYGKVYRIRNADEMLQLLEKEKGLAWTAHARTKGSTGFPDQYKTSAFFNSPRFMGAAWKAMPADLSQPKLGNGRVLDLMDDMNNWGLHKKVIGEADLFTIEPENEMYAHLNVNYLQLEKIPAFDEGWGSVLDAMENGRFFTTTGEILIPDFTVDGEIPGPVVKLENPSNSKISFKVDWTFPLHFAEIVTGDGKTTFRQTINLEKTKAFGHRTFNVTADLNGKKWVRLEIWDVARNGAFTQTIWLK